MSKAKPFAISKQLVWQAYKRVVNRFVRGWLNYYGRFYRSEFVRVLWSVSYQLVNWCRRKYRDLRQHRRQAVAWLRQICHRQRDLFIHWQLGLTPAAGQ